MPSSYTPPGGGGGGGTIPNTPNLLIGGASNTAQNSGIDPANVTQLVLQKVVDSTARFAGTWKLGDLIKEVGAKETITLNINAETGNNYDDGGGTGRYFSIYTPDAVQHSFWFNVSGMDVPGSTPGTQHEVDINSGDSASTIAVAITAALAVINGSYSITNNGTNISVIGLTSFVVTSPITLPSAVDIVEDIVGIVATNALFEVIDITATGDETGYAAKITLPLTSTLGALITDGHGYLTSILVSNSSSDQNAIVQRQSGTINANTFTTTDFSGHGITLNSDGTANFNIGAHAITLDAVNLTSNRLIKFPDIDGTIMLNIPDTGWTANSTVGDKTTVVAAYSAVNFSALDVTNIGLNALSTQVANLTKKFAAVETVLVAAKLPNA